jgi:hypothetical protein
VTERHYALLLVLLPGLALAALAGYSAGAGCYALTMNCFSVVVPDDSLTRALFSLAAFVPFGAPAYAPVAASGVTALRRGGAAAVDGWLWIAPVLYAALVHGGCVLFAGAVLPERRVHPGLRLDVAIVAGGYVYVALARLARPFVVRKPRGPWARA